MADLREFIVDPADAGQRLDVFVARVSGLSRARVHALIEAGVRPRRGPPAEAAVRGQIRRAGDGDDPARRTAGPHTRTDSPRDPLRGRPPAGPEQAGGTRRPSRRRAGDRNAGSRAPGPLPEPARDRGSGTAGYRAPTGPRHLGGDGGREERGRAPIAEPAIQEPHRPEAVSGPGAWRGATGGGADRGRHRAAGARPEADGSENGGRADGPDDLPRPAPATRHDAGRTGARNGAHPPDPGSPRPHRPSRGGRRGVRRSPRTAWRGGRPACAPTIAARLAARVPPSDGRGVVGVRGADPRRFHDRGRLDPADLSNPPSGRRSSP